MNWCEFSPKNYCLIYLVWVVAGVLAACAPPLAGEQDASAVMAGICFEAALDAAGQVFVLRSPAALEAFYDLADNSELCRQPVTRAVFDFSGGRALAGLWSAGEGCTAQHEQQGFTRAEGQITLMLRFTTSGDCPYELVRPFWVALENAASHAITITVE